MREGQQCCSWAQGQSFPSSPGKPGYAGGSHLLRAVVGQGPGETEPRLLSLNTDIYSPVATVLGLLHKGVAAQLAWGEMHLPARPGLRTLPSYHARVDTIMAIVSMEYMGTGQKRWNREALSGRKARRQR